MLPATYHDLVSELPGAPADVICECLERELSVADAQQFFIAWQAAEIKKAESLAAEIQAESERIAKQQAYRAVLVRRGLPVDDPVGAWRDLLNAKLSAGMDRAEATRELAHEQPDLRLEMLAVVNAKRREQHPNN